MQVKLPQFFQGGQFFEPGSRNTAEREVERSKRLEPGKVRQGQARSGLGCPPGRYLSSCAALVDVLSTTAITVEAVSVPERPEAFVEQFRPVVDFMRQQYWHVYDPAERQRMLAALTVVTSAERTEEAAELDGVDRLVEPLPTADDPEGSSAG